MRKTIDDAGRKVERFPALIEEAFEHEMIFHRINRRDSETITNCAVRGAPPALDHDVVFATEIDDVPDNQEISGETEVRDQGKFFFKLSLHLRTNRSVTLLRTEPDDGAQKRIHRVTDRHRIFGKF